MTTYYLGSTKNGAIVARSSTRADFTHAACTSGHKAGDLIRASASTWSTSADGALANAASSWRLKGDDVELVAVRKVTGEVWVSVGERDDDGGVWRYDVKRRKGTLPAGEAR